jgi:hypothetical protein
VKGKLPENGKVEQGAISHFQEDKYMKNPGMEE